MRYVLNAARRPLRWLLPLIALVQTATANTETITQGISLTLYSAGELSVPSTLTLTNPGTTFGNFTGTLSVNYRARTTPSGSGNIVLAATSDFSPATGPSISAGSLTFTCGSPGLGTSCSGTQTVQVSNDTTLLVFGGSVCTGGGGSCTSSDPVSVQLSFVLTNSPQYKTGVYTAPLLLTMSVL